MSYNFGAAKSEQIQGALSVNAFFTSRISLLKGKLFEFGQNLLVSGFWRIVLEMLRQGESKRVWELDSGPDGDYWRILKCWGQKISICSLNRLGSCVQQLKWLPLTLAKVNFLYWKLGGKQIN